MRIKAPGKYPDKFYISYDRFRKRAAFSLIWSTRPTYKRILRKLIRRKNKLIFKEEIND